MASKKQLETILADIRAYCVANADEKMRAKYAKYFKEGYDAYGLGKEKWEAGKEKFVDANREKLNLKDALKLGDVLLESGKYEEASFAIYFALAFKDSFTKETFQHMGKWLEKGIRNWAHTDILCSLVAAEFFKNNIAGFEEMASWRESKTKWKRRAVPVAMIDILKLTKEYQPLLDFLDPLMMDDEEMVQKGLGWFLRETWKKQPQVVEAFLLKWKDAAPRLIFQYATEKMTKEGKERFRREKKNGKERCRSEPAGIRGD